MLAKRIIPCLDVDHGRVMKGVHFLGLREVGQPTEMATEYERQGADELVFLDISASREGRATMLRVVQETAESLFIPLTVGGGIRTVEEMRQALGAGADKIAINTAAVARPSLIGEGSREFGSQCIVVAIDAKRTGASWRVHTHGGSRETELDAVSWARRVVELGAGEILLTSMDKDGTTDGYDAELTRAVVRATNVPVIASGGAGTLEHVRSVLVEGNADAALAASVFHYGQLTVGKVKEYLRASGVRVRLGGSDGD